MSLRVRFAPSPTGAIHIGNARTALFNWLYARKENGKFILRIEDTDLARSDEASEQAIFRALTWLGLDWDEGPDKPDSPHHPYFQSGRQAYYNSLADRLLSSGKAYLCYDSEAELEAERAEWLKAPRLKKRHPHRDLTPEQRQSFEREGRKPSIRFATDDLGGEVAYVDLVRGEVKVEMDEIRDFNLVKSDGTPMYNFACVADDHAMQITQVLRGEDGISNTPRQLLIYSALGWTPPTYGHLSFILGPDGQKLSKRHGHFSVEDLRAAGYLPEAVINYLALLGMGGHGEGEEIYSRQQLIDMFYASNLIKKSAQFDQGKLDFLNAHYLRLKSPSELRELAMPMLGPFAERPKEWLEEALDTFKGNSHKLSDFLPQFEAAFGEAAEHFAAVREKVAAFPMAKKAVEALHAQLESFFPADAASAKDALKAAQKSSGAKGKDFFMPVRLALTAQEHGPELDRLMPLIGRLSCLRRLEVFMGLD